MKNKYLLLFTLIIFASCSKKGIITMNVLEPSEVWVHPSIKKLGIVNRTLPTDKTKPLDNLEKLLTLEGVNLDKEGAESCASSVQSRLSQYDRFPDLVFINDKELKTVGVGVFPSALSAGTVTNLCKHYQVDAIVSLEFFDTDTKVSVNLVNTTMSTPLGNVPTVIHKASLNTLIKTGWRMYDSQGAQIIDQYFLNRNMNSYSEGINPVEAVKALAGRKDMVKQMGSEAGSIYADRLLPYWTRVTRDYYTRGSSNLKIATRKARSGNWDGAAEMWKNEIGNPNPKIAGRACYNYAIIHEINGNLDEAIKWSQKAYEDYNQKLALKYIRILKNRQARIKRLDS